MRMIRPEVKAPITCIAKNQAEYSVLTVARVVHPTYEVHPEKDHNSLLMAFRLDASDREKFVRGADIYVSLLTGGGPMQPILVVVGKEEAARVFGVEVEP